MDSSKITKEKLSYILHPKATNKNNIPYDYILNKILLSLPDMTPREVEKLFETMQDFDLLSKDGDKIKEILWNGIWKE